MEEIQSATRSSRKYSGGVCHRCGWRGEVAKFGRRERKMLGSRREFGRVCRTCFAELANRESQTDSASSRDQRDLHVA
jgi:hypothetical protein